MRVLHLLLLYLLHLLLDVLHLLLCLLWRENVMADGQ